MQNQLSVTQAVNFKELIRDVNIESPYLENTVLMCSVVSQCIETICSYDKERMSMWVSGIVNQDHAISVNFTEQGMLLAKIYFQRIEGFVPFVSAVKNLSMEGASRFILDNFGYFQLARLLGLKRSGGYSSSISYLGTDPKVICPKVIKIGERNFYKSTGLLFRNYSGAVDFCVISYVNKEYYFLLPCALYANNSKQGIRDLFLAPGLHESKHLLFNANVLNSTKNLNVLFFENLRIAGDFHNRIQDSLSVSKNEYVSTAHYGGINYINDVDFSCLYGQNVYIISFPSKESYLKIIDYAEKCLSAGANKVMIVLDPILEYPKYGSDVDYAALPCPFERFVAHNAFCYKERELSPMIYRILKYAIPFERYFSWAQEMMLIDVPNSVPSNESFSSLVSNGYDMVCKPLKDMDDNVISLNIMLRPDKVTMLAGYSHEGKTMFMMSLILAHIAGIDLLIFKNNNPGKVLLVDSESGEDFVQEVLMQLSQAYDVNKSVLRGFKYISLLDMPRDRVNDFDLLSENTQLELKAYVEDNGVNLLVLDNLQSMFENASASSKTLYLLIKFVELMQSIGIAVLLVHHTIDSKKDKPQGLTQLVNRMRNWILLEGPATLGPELEKLGVAGDPFVKKFIDEPGVLARVVFKKCNSYPRLRGRKFLYHLPYANIRNQEPKKWISDIEGHNYYGDGCLCSQDNVDFLNPVESASYTNEAIDIAPIDDFKNNCDKVIEYAQDHSGFNGVQIQRAFSWSKKPVKKILDHLVESGVLDRTGSTSSRMYRLRVDYDKI
jgi:hypothetical protein